MVDHRPPVIERAILIALAQRLGGRTTLPIDKLAATTDVTWALEGFRVPEDLGQVHIRLRRLD